MEKIIFSPQPSERAFQHCSGCHGNAIKKPPRTNVHSGWRSFNTGISATPAFLPCFSLSVFWISGLLRVCCDCHFKPPCCIKKDSFLKQTKRDIMTCKETIQKAPRQSFMFFFCFWEIRKCDFEKLVAVILWGHGFQKDLIVFVHLSFVIAFILLFAISYLQKVVSGSLPNLSVSLSFQMLE